MQQLQLLQNVLITQVFKVYSINHIAVCLCYYGNDRKELTILVNFSNLRYVMTGKKLVPTLFKVYRISFTI